MIRHTDRLNKGVLMKKPTVFTDTLHNVRGVFAATDTRGVDSHAPREQNWSTTDLALFGLQLGANAVLAAAGVAREVAAEVKSYATVAVSGLSHSVRATLENQRQK